MFLVVNDQLIGAKDGHSCGKRPNLAAINVSRPLFQIEKDCRQKGLRIEFLIPFVIFFVKNGLLLSF